MSGFPLVDRQFYENSPMIAALLYLAATGQLARNRPRSPEDGPFGLLYLTTANHQRNLLLALAAPYGSSSRFRQRPGSQTDPASYRDRPLPPGNALLSFPVKHFDSLRKLRDHLVDSHQPRYWYRGQNFQHAALYEGQLATLARLDPNLPARNPLVLYSPEWMALAGWLNGMRKSSGSKGLGLENLPRLDPPGHVRLAFDSVIGSFFRSATRTQPAQWDGAAAHDLPPLDYFPRIARAIIESPRDNPVREMLLRFLRDVARPAMLAAVRRAGGLHIRDPEAEARALPFTNLPQSHLDLISLAQHYEYGSVMVDVTRSIDVAIWFAAFRWKDGSLIGSSSDDVGVIYRFDEEAIKRVLEVRFLHESGGPSLVPALGLFGLADISSLSADIARRPVAQRGGSLLGFENSVLHLLLHDGGGVEAFVFPHRSADGTETPLRKSHLCPDDDPALAVFRPGEAGEESPPVTPEELDGFLSASGLDEAERRQIVHLRTMQAL
jgi:hypothetical protein